MKAFHILCIATMLSGVAAFGMEIEKKEVPFKDVFQAKQESALQSIVGNPHYDRNKGIEKIVSEIRHLGKNNEIWQKILDSKSYTEILLHKVSRSMIMPKDFTKNLDDLLYNQEEHINFEIALALLGTPGAVEYGKEYIKQDSKKENLRDYLFEMVRFGTNESGSNCSLAWQDQDCDVVKAALDMGFDPDITWYNILLQKQESLLMVAVDNNKSRIVKLLRDGNANLDFIDDRTKRTPLTLAVSQGYLDIVILLLTAQKIDLSFVDGWGETPAQCLKYLEDGSKRRKEAYLPMVKLLKGAGVAITL